MNGAGNDFIVIDNRFYHFSSEELSDLAQRLCRRRFGIGADGILAFSEPMDGENDYRMIYYNADGSRGTMCGNGARCLVRFARDAGITKDELQFETDAGVYRAVFDEGDLDRVRLYVQPPRDYRENVGLRHDLPSELSEPYYIWTGVEHLVLFTGDVEEAPVRTLGPVLRRDEALQPAGANINFVQVTSKASPAALSVRTFEKGVEAETLACGTGAMASALVAQITGRVDNSPIDVQMRGGLLRVGFERSGSEISELFLEGPVEHVYRGTVYV